MFISNYELGNIYEELTLPQAAIYLYLRLKIQENMGKFQTSMRGIDEGVRSCPITVKTTVQFLVKHGYISEEKIEGGLKRHIFSLPEPEEDES